MIFSGLTRAGFVGRKGHRVTLINKNLYTIPCEAIFNNHPEVFRSALAGIVSRTDAMLYFYDLLPD